MPDGTMLQLSTSGDAGGKRLKGSNETARADIHIQGNAAFGEVNTATAHYRVQSRDGFIEIAEFEPMPPLQNDVLPRPGLRKNDSEYPEPDRSNRIALNQSQMSLPREAAPVSETDDDVSIDVLVMYSQRARARLSGLDGTVVGVDRLMAHLREVFDNTLVDFQLRLVGVVPFTVTAIEPVDVMFNAISAIHGDYGADGLRRRYAADLVHLIDYSPDSTSGVSGLGDMFFDGYERSDYGLSITRLPSFNGRWEGTSAHEIGHNTGQAHDKGDIDLVPFYSYAYSYTCGKGPQSAPLRTLMDRSGADHDFFSTPLVEIDGEPCGVAGPGGHDARTAILKTAAVMASLRDAQDYGSTLTLSIADRVSASTRTLSVAASRTGDAAGPARFALLAGSDGDEPLLEAGDVTELAFGPGQASGIFDLPLHPSKTLAQGDVITLIQQGGVGVNTDPTQRITYDVRSAQVTTGSIGFAVTGSIVQADQTSLDLRLRRTGGIDGDVVVTVRTAGGTAEPDIDYTPIDQTVTFADGQELATITLGFPPAMTGRTGERTVSIELVGTDVDPAKATMQVTRRYGATNGGGGGGVVSPWPLVLAMFCAVATRRRASRLQCSPGRR